MRKIFQTLTLVFSVIFAVSLNSCNHDTKKTQSISFEGAYQDGPFMQEFHDAYKIGDNPADNEVRSIVADLESNIWIATASGVFMKKLGSRVWNPVIAGDDRGPAYSVVVNPKGDVLMGTWNGIYRFSNSILKKEEGIKDPISVICNDRNENYALGPCGIWRSNANKWELQEFKIARTIRDAITDGKGNLWEIGRAHV